MVSVEVRDLTKHFRLRQGPLFKKRTEILRAVNGVSFSINKGEIFSLLGPNGAGKTTTIKMLATLLIPNSGTASVLGYDIVREDFQVRKILTAVLPGERTLYWKLTVKENLRYFGSLYGLESSSASRQIDKLLSFFDIEEKRNVLVEKLSSGQKQKVVLSRALLPDPQVILLDEPTLGLDPSSAKSLRQLIKEISSQGKTILLTTHYMYEADEISDKVAIINDGKIVRLDTSANLKRELNTEKILRLQIDRWSERLEAELSRKYGFSKIECQSKNGHYELEANLPPQKPLKGDFKSPGLPEVAKFCHDHDIAINKASVDEPTLEDVFIAHTGRKLAADEETKYN